MRQNATPYRRGPYTSKGKQERVKGRRMAGQTVREIAKAEGLSKNTVSRICSQEEIDQLMSGYRSVIVEEMVPLALKSLRWHLKKKDRQATIETLYGSKALSQYHEIEVTSSGERDYASAKVDFFGKYGRWPTDEEAKEFDKTIPRKALVKQLPAEIG